MNDDIVDQLRSSMTHARALDRAPLLRRAANEIERLRRRMRLLDAAIRQGLPEPTIQLIQRIDKWKNEVENLRAEPESASALLDECVVQLSLLQTPGRDARGE